MNFQSIWSLVQENLIGAIVVAVIAIVVIAGPMSVLAQRIGFHLGYPIVLAVVGAIFLVAGIPLYFWPFLLGMATACAEIISKFSDDPMKAFNTPHALIYVVLNGAVAAFALYFLALLASFDPTYAGVGKIDQLKYAVVAGLGAMLIMRSKLFNIKVGADDVSFGPEQIIKIVFRFLQAGIDRSRAQVRFSFVKEKLKNINFDAVRYYCETQLLSAQALEKDEREACLKRINEIAGKTLPQEQPKVVTQLKSHELGYLLLNTMGEQFVTGIFTPRDTLPKEWLIEAETGEAKADGMGKPGLLNWVPGLGKKEEEAPAAAVVSYMAYGSNMSSNRLLSQLNWTDAEGQEKWKSVPKPTKCVLADYHLAFNKVDASAGPPADALANIVRDDGNVVLGVLYELPKDTFDFLKQREEGYHELSVKVTADGKVVDAQVFIADPDKVADKELPPNKEALNAIIEGAGEHGLASGYIEELQRLAAQLPSSATVVTTNGGKG